MKIKGPKKILFDFVLFLPYFILLVFLSALATNLYKAGNVDYGAVRTGVREFLLSDRSEVRVDRSARKLLLSYRYLFPGGKGPETTRVLDFEPSGDAFDIVVLGSSPVYSVSPLAGGAEGFFPEKLEKGFKEKFPEEKVRVYNLGMTSADSSVIRGIAEKTGGGKGIDLAVFYYGGGMDLETAYYAAGVKEKHYILDLIPGKRPVGPGGGSQGSWAGTAGKYLSWFNRTYVQPYFLYFFQKAGLLELPYAPFAEINAMITDEMLSNIKAAVSVFRENGVPVVLVSPLSNLEARPYGIKGVTDRYYEMGMSSGDPGERYMYLSMARDSEAFTGDLGPRLRMIRELPYIAEEMGEDVYFFDLAAELIPEWKGFGYRYFFDYGHMKPVLHRLVAEKIYVYLTGKGLAARPGKKKKDETGGKY
ncbi:MAG: hypothetical protein GF408_05615 [Candidatus Omnitrophica bacterium]|nr:hypothetical protein [Candidatus Omnitrophota bacterium]